MDDFPLTLRQLRQALTAPGAGLTDGQLLGRFVAGRDEAAFEALVHRHGPMVRGLCRRVLHNTHDAEDAFQAAFLLLARKAASVVKRDSVGSWLFAVASRTALEARAALDRRRTRERQLDEMPHPEVAPEEVQDWRPLLDRAIARLPEKYRAPVVLYHLEGHSHREVARQLGLPEGTLAGRLARARRLLAVRLARQGMTLAVGVLAVQSAPAAVPAGLVNSTVRAAALLAAGELAVLATPAAALMKGALQTMFLQKLKVMAAMAVVVLVLGAGGLAYRGSARAVAADKPRAGRPLTELEALRREVELLKLNLEVVLEKVRAQDAELRELRGKKGADPRLDRFKEDPATRADEERLRKGTELQRIYDPSGTFLKAAELERLRAEARRLHADKEKILYAARASAVKVLEDAVKALQQARNTREQQQALDALEEALRKLLPDRAAPYRRLTSPESPRRK